MRFQNMNIYSQDPKIFAVIFNESFRTSVLQYFKQYKSFNRHTVHIDYKTNPILRIALRIVSTRLLFIITTYNSCLKEKCNETISLIAILNLSRGDKVENLLWV